MHAEETLLEMATDAMPFLAIRVKCNRLVWSGLDIVWEGKPVIAA
jgi:hypothetical protein